MKSLYVVVSVLCLIIIFSFKKKEAKSIQIQEKQIFFSINDEENFIIDNLYLYSKKGKFSIEEEVLEANWNNYFLKYKGKIIGKYKYVDSENSDEIICELYVNNKRISNQLGISKTISLKSFNKDNFLKEIQNFLEHYPKGAINTAEVLNNKGYFLFKFKYYDASLIYLNKTIQLFPNRVVAHLNIADCYWNINQKAKAIESYNKYISLMKSQKKDLKKIPKYVYERIKK